MQPSAEAAAKADGYEPDPKRARNPRLQRLNSKSGPEACSGTKVNVNPAATRTRMHEATPQGLSRTILTPLAARL